MGREIRRVPPDWEHPRYTKEDAPFSNRVMKFRPMHDKDFESTAQEWSRNFDLWRRGKHPDQKKDCCKEYKFYWQWAGDPPDEDYYRPKWNKKPSHYQVYETVSEGTPVTPHFETKEELIDYLATHGDFWDQKDGSGGWDRKSAEEFVNQGWAPSGVFQPSTGFKTVKEPGFYPPKVSKIE